MSYNDNTWIDGTSEYTLISAEALNNMETGIKRANQLVDFFLDGDYITDAWIRYQITQPLYANNPAYFYVYMDEIKTQNPWFAEMLQTYTVVGLAGLQFGVVRNTSVFVPSGSHLINFKYDALSEYVYACVNPGSYIYSEDTDSYKLDINFILIKDPTKTTIESLE